MEHMIELKPVNEVTHDAYMLALNNDALTAYDLELASDSGVLTPPTSHQTYSDLLRRDYWQFIRSNTPVTYRE